MPERRHYRPRASIPAPRAVMNEGDVASTPTLHEAFVLLCEALAPHTQEDMPRWLHLQDIQGWYADAGEDASGRAQTALAWSHAIAILEGVLGIPIMQR